MRYGFGKRLLLAACITPMCGLLMSSCAKTHAQAPATGRSCHAEVASLGATQQCPTSSIKFHVSVADCDNSSGTFEYDYLSVSEGQKVPVHASGSWNAAQKESDQVQNVPQACSDEVVGIDQVTVTSCHCPS
jgi:hypothetical protein